MESAGIAVEVSARVHVFVSQEIAARKGQGQ